MGEPKTERRGFLKAAIQHRLLSGWWTVRPESGGAANHLREQRVLRQLGLEKATLMFEASRL